MGRQHKRHMDTAPRAREHAVTCAQQRHKISISCSTRARTRFAGSAIRHAFDEVTCCALCAEQVVTGRLGYSGTEGTNRGCLVPRGNRQRTLISIVKAAGLAQPHLCLSALVLLLKRRRRLLRSLSAEAGEGTHCHAREGYATPCSQQNGSNKGATARSAEDRHPNDAKDRLGGPGERR